MREDVVSKFVGPPIQDSLVDYAGLPLSRAQEGADIFRNYYKQEALFKACVYPGVFPLLHQLRASKIKMAVATYKREDYAVKLLNHFGMAHYFDVVHGADNENRQTKADIIVKCVDEISLNKENVIMVGDTVYDARGAEGAGVKFVIASWGFGDVDEIVRENEKWCPSVVRTPIDVLRIVTG